MMRFRELLFDEPILDRRERSRTNHSVALDRHVIDWRYCRSQVRKQRRPENLLQRQMQSRLAGARNNSQRQNGIATKVKKIIVRRNIWYLQYARPDACQKQLIIASRLPGGAYRGLLYTWRR